MKRTYKSIRKLAVKRNPPLTKEHIDELFYVDATNGIVIRKSSNKSAGYIQGRTEEGRKKYVSIMVNGKAYRRAYIVFCCVTGKWPVEWIDHINGDSLDDRIDNIREATETENRRNRKKWMTKKNDMPQGVSMRKVGKKYRARIRVNKKLISLGEYSDIKDAISAYRKARSFYFGEFA